MSNRISPKSNRLLEQRVVSTGVAVYSSLAIESSTVEWTMRVVNRVCMTRSLFALREVLNGEYSNALISPTIWQSAF